MTDGVNKLSEEELYECLKSLNVPTQLSDIQTPTRSFLSIKHIEYPEIIEGGQYIVLLVMFVNFITSADCLEIYARDIIFPKPKRTKKILNYLIVFWKYFLMKYSNFQALVEKFNEEKREVDELSEENDHLIMKYNECLLILKNEHLNKEELISCNALKQEKKKEFEKQKEMLTEENNASKKKENDLRTLLTTADVNIVSTKEQIKELEEMILTSPEKISNKLKKLKDSIHEEEKKIKDKETELNDQKKRLDSLEQILENNEKYLEDLKNINKTLETFGNVMKSYIVDRQKCQEEEENLKKLENELRKKDELKSSNKHKSAKIHLKYMKQKESYNETIQMLQRDLAQEQKDLIRLKEASLELDQKMDKEVETILEIVEKCQATEKTTKKLQMDFKSEMESIGNAFVSECGDIKNYIAKKFAP